MRKNKNDIPLTIKDLREIKIKLSDIPKKLQFKFLCSIYPNITNDCLEIIKEEDSKYLNIHRRGLVYVFVIEGKVLKVGSTTQSFKERVKSYNCGTSKARKKGTCSTTNYFVLQSLLNFKKEVKVYAFFTPTISQLVFGETEKISLPPKQWEKSILKKMKEKKKMPIFCTQT